MFETTLLESSPRRESVLRPIHHLLSTFAAAGIFVLGLYGLPLLLGPANDRALFVTAAVAGAVSGLFALMLCYVWADTRQQHWQTGLWLSLTFLLNLLGFLIYLVYSAHKTGDWKRAAIPLAYVAESALVGVLVLVPLIYTQALPRQLLLTEIHIPPPPGPRPSAQPAGRPAPVPRRPAVNPLAAPMIIPTRVAQVIEAPEPVQPEVGQPGPFVPGVPPGFGTGPGSTPGAAPWGTEPPAPPPPLPRSAPKHEPQRVGGDVIAARALYQPKPIYPPLAILAHIQGTVVLQAILSKDGTVQHLTVLRGPAMLVQAAMDAVRTWRYQPTLLNTEPVEVLTEIDVTFKLGE